MYLRRRHTDGRGAITESQYTHFFAPFDKLFNDYFSTRVSEHPLDQQGVRRLHRLGSGSG